MGKYQGIIETLKQMMQDEVKLVHGGCVIDWEETKIPELLKEASSPSNSEIPAGTQLKHNFSGQDYWVSFDDGKSISLSTMHNIIYYPKEIIGGHFDVVDKGRRMKIRHGHSC